MKTNFFSVVIPTYNQGELLKKAINSVFAQSYKNYEIIIIDDFSEDQTENIVKNFGSEKIIYRKMKNNKNIGKSRNEGIKISKGQWIAFLDSDDQWYSNRLEVLSNFIKNNVSYDVLCTDDLIDDKIRNRKKVWRYGPYTTNFYETLLRKGSCITTSASAVKKDFLLTNNIKFDEKKEFFTAEDYDFFLRVALAGGKFKFLREVLGKHLLYKDSNSANYFMHKNAIAAVTKNHVFNIQKFTNNKNNLWNKVEINFYFMDAIYLFTIEKKYFKSLFIIVKMLLFRPIYTSYLILRKLKRFFL